MALGATVRVGVDASGVRRGLGAIQGMFSRFGGALRGLGGMVGGGRALLGGLTLLGAGALAAREAVGVARLGGDLSDMALQTGTSARALMELSEAFRIAGADMGEASTLVTQFGMRLDEAQRSMTAPSFDALRRLGIVPRDLKGLDLVEAMGRVTAAIKRARDAGRDMAEISAIAGDLFGRRRGGTYLRFALDFEETMVRARRNLGSLPDTIGDNVEALDRVADSLGLIRLRLREMMAAGLARLPLDRLSRMVEAAGQNPAGFLKRSIEVSPLGDLLEGVRGGFRDWFGGILSTIDARMTQWGREFGRSVMDGLGLSGAAGFWRNLRETFLTETAAMRRDAGRLFGD